MQFDKNTFRLSGLDGQDKKALLAGVAGLLLTIVGVFVIDNKQVFYSYLTAYVFWLTLALGGLFFTMLHHLVGAVWSVVLRRLAESLMIILPFMAVLFIPIVIGMHDLYHWTHADVVATDPLLQGKAAYLNTTFFIIRAILYFALWFLMARSLYKTSLQQDQAFNKTQAAKMRKVSAPGMVIFAFSVSFAAFDWLMSLDPHWYSTIFGVYIFSGGLLAAIALMTVISLYMRRRGVMTDIITLEHYHDLGKLIFAFTVFWAYIAFSQYLLIWYANLPEETIWYSNRWIGSWKYVSLLIVFGHFGIPFFIMITRVAKRSFRMMTFISLWILLMHWVDMYWVVMPNLSHQGFHLSWVDFTATVGIGGIFFWLFWRQFAGHPVVPVKDPNLKASIEFVNF